MNYGEILSAAWTICRRHRIVLAFGLPGMALPALLSVGLGVWLLFADRLNPNLWFWRLADQGAGAMALPVLASLIFPALTLLLTAVGNAGTLRGVERGLQGGAVGLADLWPALFPAAWRILALLVLISLAAAGLIFFPWLLGVLTGGLGFVCLAPLVFLLLPFGLLMYLLISLGQAVIVGEDLGPGAALTRVRDLLRAAFWPWALLSLLVYLIQTAVSTAILLPISLVGFLAPLLAGGGDPALAFRVVSGLMALFVALAFLVQGLAMAFANAVWMTAYLRHRDAGADERRVE